MKTTNRILILMAVMSFMACKNQMHVVTLYVKTAEIEQNSIEANANFDQPLGIANRDFITNVRRGDLIIWQGQSTSNPEHSVNITSIEHVSGDKIIGQKSVKTKMMNNKQVFRKIDARPGREKVYLEEKYNLKFTVSNKEGIFIIDPKIRSHQ